MTLHQLLKLTNDHQLRVLQEQAKHMRLRRFGVQSQVDSKELLLLELLQLLVESNDDVALNDTVMLPAWLPAAEFDKIISVVIKRTLL
jgi:hypothetical protein